MFDITIIARVKDSLPLASYISEDDGIGEQLYKLDVQMKGLLKYLVSKSDYGCYKSEGNVFYYLIKLNVAYLTLTDEKCPNMLAFDYLAKIQKRFENNGYPINQSLRPYSFLDFDSTIKQVRLNFIKNYRSKSSDSTHLPQIYIELDKVANITAKNIEDVLRRGEGIEDLDKRAEAISMFSGRFKNMSTDLNKRASCIKISIVLFLILILVILIRLYLF